ncbi:kelch-like protein 20 [Oscarella lobularis]|uniref:kelch-like protein 20 n=1 Tax=Oscarella lobularis TaxID=121494 RepID=UPI00331409AF
MVKKIAFQTRGKTKTAMATIDSYRKSNYLCDVVICTEDGQRFPAHRIILASASDFFSAMFGGAFLESERNRTDDDVAIRNVEGAAMKMLIEYAYRGKTECPESAENVLSLYEAAQYIQMDELVRMCSDWLKDHVDHSNCVSIGIVADKYGNSDLLRIADDFAARNLFLVAESEDFLSLSFERVIRTLSRGDIRVKSEGEFLNILHKWIEHDEASRRRHVEALSKFVRFPLTDFDESKDVLSGLDLVSHYHSSDGGTIRRQLGCDAVLLVAGGGSNEPETVSKEARIYDAYSDTWSTFPSLAVGTYSSRIATSCDVTYAFGGYTSFNCSSRIVQRYDAEQRRWVDDVPPMSTSRAVNEIVCCTNRIYGISNSYCKSGCEVFDPEKKAWAPVSVSQSDFQDDSYIVCSVADKIYVIGFTGGCELGYKMYDPREDRWCKLELFRDLPNEYVSLLDPCNLYATMGDRVYIYPWKWCNNGALIFDGRSERFSFVENFFPLSDCFGLAYDVDSKRMFMLGSENCEQQVAVYEERVNRWHCRAFERKDDITDFGCAVVDRKLMF